MILTLNSDEVHLWFAFPEEIDDPELLAHYHELMNEEESAQQQRFYFEEHRHQYLVTRALVRTILSRYTNLPSKEWRFVKNSYGRPEIDPELGIQGLRFNISHTSGLIVCATIMEKDMGVDVEDRRRRGQTVEIADRFFSASEVADLRRLPQLAQKDHFFDYWTLKEAYIKARGMGLSIPLDQFSYHIAPAQPLSISFDDRLQDIASDWQLLLFKPTLHHTGALAIRRGCEAPLQIHMHRYVPLRGNSPLHCTVVASSSPS